MTDLPNTPRLTPTRYRELASHDRERFRETLASHVVAHVGFVRDGAPMVLPTGYGFDDDYLYIHGSTGSSFYRDMGDGRPLCISITSLDGFVYARSTYDSAVQYRSIVIFGSAEQLEGDAKVRAFDIMTEHLMPGRLTEVRPSTTKELAATMALRVSLAEASLKILDGGVEETADDGEDHSVWAGTLPLRLIAGDPDTAPLTPPATLLPESVRLQQQRFSPR
jgi:nitroimidazol reductase NimA-like FMN-containing flavoprotein (pyridoxamine 5'-phosphate oxidase superfamily)